MGLNAQQFELFDLFATGSPVGMTPVLRPMGAPLADLPRARVEDPETSHRAASRLKKSLALGRQQKIVLLAVRRWPGLTATELSRCLGRTSYCIRTKAGIKCVRPTMDEWRYIVSRRAAELAVIWIQRGPARECRINHTLQCIWEPRDREEIRARLAGIAERAR
jgi:hypothetical protein